MVLGQLVLIQEFGLLLGLCPTPDRDTLCSEHFQPLFLFQDLNKVVTFGCDLSNGLECFARLPLENPQLQSALWECVQGAVKTRKHSEEILVVFSQLQLNCEDPE